MHALCLQWGALHRAGLGTSCPHGVVPVCTAAEEELAQAALLRCLAP